MPRELLWRKGFLNFPAENLPFQVFTAEVTGLSSLAALRNNPSFLNWTDSNFWGWWHYHRGGSSIWLVTPRTLPRSQESRDQPGQLLRAAKVQSAWTRTGRIISVESKLVIYILRCFKSGNTEQQTIPPCLATSLTSANGRLKTIRKLKWKSLNSQPSGSQPDVWEKSKASIQMPGNGAELWLKDPKSDKVAVGMGGFGENMGI